MSLIVAVMTPVVLSLMAFASVTVIGSVEVTVTGEAESPVILVPEAAKRATTSSAALAFTVNIVSPVGSTVTDSVVYPSIAIRFAAVPLASVTVIVSALPDVPARPVPSVATKEVISPSVIVAVTTPAVSYTHLTLPTRRFV